MCGAGFKLERDSSCKLPAVQTHIYFMCGSGLVYGPRPTVRTTRCPCAPPEVRPHRCQSIAAPSDAMPENTHDSLPVDARAVGAAVPVGVPLFPRRRPSDIAIVQNPQTLHRLTPPGLKHGRLRALAWAVCHSALGARTVKTVAERDRPVLMAVPLAGRYHGERR